MDLKEYLVKSIAEIDGMSATGDVSSGGMDEETIRKEAIEIIKEKGYELNETNLQMVIKNLTKQKQEACQSQTVMDSLSANELNVLVDMYNKKLREKMQIQVVETKPEDLIFGEEGYFSCYTYIKFDPRCYVDFSTSWKRIFDKGMIGKIFATETRLILNYFPTIYPVEAMISINRSEISCVTITGPLCDEIEITLKSGQRIKFGVEIGLAVSLVEKIIKWSNYK